MDKFNFDKKLDSLDFGSYSVWVDKIRYIFSKQKSLEGKVIKVYAKEAGGNDFISFNYYRTSTKDILKPCEMPRQKVIDFVINLKLEKPKNE